MFILACIIAFIDILTPQAIATRPLKSVKMHNPISYAHISQLCISCELSFVSTRGFSDGYDFTSLVSGYLLFQSTLYASTFQYCTLYELSFASTCRFSDSHRQLNKNVDTSSQSRALHLTFLLI